MRRIIMWRAGTATAKLPTERPHREVLSDYYSNVMKKSVHPAPEEMEGKQIITGQRSNSPNKKSGGIPFKMLISKEMFGDTNSRRKPPSVVARLMGLDSLPLQQSAADDGKIRKNGCLCNGLNGEIPQYQLQDGDYVDNSMAHEKKDYRDVFEVQTQPSKNEDQFPQKVGYDEDSYQRRMALVRQKFNEAKRLATDGNFLDSGEFHDAIEVLNLNRDLFLKFLEEPHSLYTNHLFEHQSISPPQTTHITVLKPSNTMGRSNTSTERQLLTDSDGSVGKANKHYWSSDFSETKGQDLLQPMRIVVLKPGRAKSGNVEVTLPSNVPTSLSERSSSGATVTDESIILKDIAGGIFQQGQESIGSSRKDETVSSSVLSNGYIGDESSFYRSESESMEDEVGSLSDSEIATSATDCSWDYTNKIGSPFSASSLNQAFHFPEPSVIREAKKRLSERLALVASNVNNPEQTQSWRSSSTLGEVLALPKLKEEERSKEDPAHPHKPFDVEDDLRAQSWAFPTLETKFDFNWENSCRSLSRSKSVPVNSSACEVDKLDVGICSSLNSKPTFHKEVPKPKKGKFSFKDKVSGIFFPKSKKPSGDEPSRLAFARDALLQFANDTPSARMNVVGSDTGSAERLMFPEKPETSGNFAQNQAKSSKISFSGPTSVSDVNNGLNQSSGSASMGCVQAVSRSSPIESVARSLSRNAYWGMPSAKSLDPFIAFSKADKEHDEYLFVRKLLSSFGMDSKQSIDHQHWHSLQSPLNPSLLYDALHMVDEQDKCPEMQSSRKLLFDSTNAALLDINQSALLAAYPWGRSCHDTAGATVTDRVWATLKRGLAGDNWVLNEPGYGTIVVDSLVKEEITGRQFDESRWSEVCEFSKEIVGDALEDLVEELLSELSCDLIRK